MCFKCFFCGSDLCWDNDFDANEVFLGCYDDDDGAISSYYHCMNCGRSYTITDPSREEKENEYSDYWKENV